MRGRKNTSNKNVGGMVSRQSFWGDKNITVWILLPLHQHSTSVSSFWFQSVFLINNHPLPDTFRLMTTKLIGLLDNSQQFQAQNFNAERIISRLQQQEQQLTRHRKSSPTVTKKMIQDFSMKKENAKPEGGRAYLPGLFNSNPILVSFYQYISLIFVLLIALVRHVNCARLMISNLTQHHRLFTEHFQPHPINPLTEPWKAFALFTFQFS